MGTSNLIYREFPPSERLKQFVQCCWTLKADLPSPVHGVIPGGYTDLVLNFGESVVQDDTGSLFVSKKGSFLIGPYDSFQKFQPQGHFEYLGVRFHAGAVPFSTVFPLSSARNRAIPLEQVFPGDKNRDAFAELNRSMNGRGSTFDRLQRLQQFLMAVCDISKQPDPIVRAAIRLIEQSASQISIESVTSILNVSMRRLERKFAQHVGLSPKSFCRVHRFRRAKLLLDQSCNLENVRLAYLCGYSDQTHFIREFRLFTGQTPSVFEQFHRVGFFLYDP